ncbi:UDP-N-acetylmuramoyl-L-alanine--D-glutamate ligase [Nitrosophilus kaiyonis]|uniref:UDP-N-acetylmuramoyl-L-alanine--D-glutamate ligase n=1 Tax=Nitrosophilus kaiyonis TaxID=2930200 RepID=UPI00248FAA11|nr:UDP-N-acetylmuramoyl-L-alanine--D-glutamate ligase [Nitrosophilus kaiyonis]
MVSLFGYGKTTKSIAIFLKEKNIKTVIYDNIEKEFVDENGILHKPFNCFDPNSSSLEIPSPGIPPSHFAIKKAKNLISEYDLFLYDPLNLFDKKPFTIWISGTNGKTTTTQMIEHILKDKNAMSGGNIGTPLAMLDRDAKIWILETSSFTIHYTKYAKPNLYILLPVSEDHISWHGSYSEYKDAKTKPIKMLNEGEVCIIPKEFKDISSYGYKIIYENSEDIANFFNFDIKKIEFKEPFLLDALLSLSVSKILFDEENFEKINSFKMAPHKLEEFYDLQNRLWVDDSKATNIDATIWALQRYKNKKIYLILGGDAKGADLKPLFKILKDLNIRIYAIGKEGKNIENLSKKYKIECENTIFLENAVKKIKNLLKKDEVALLSPACASLDQFSSYKERGEKFKKFVLSQI